MLDSEAFRLIVAPFLACAALGAGAAVVLKTKRPARGAGLLALGAGAGAAAALGAYWIARLFIAAQGSQAGAAPFVLIAIAVVLPSVAWPLASLLALAALTVGAPKAPSSGAGVAPRTGDRWDRAAKAALGLAAVLALTRIAAAMTEPDAAGIVRTVGTIMVVGVAATFWTLALMLRRGGRPGWSAAVSCWLILSSVSAPGRLAKGIGTLSAPPAFLMPTARSVPPGFISTNMARADDSGYYDGYALYRGAPPWSAANPPEAPLAELCFEEGTTDWVPSCRITSGSPRTVKEFSYAGSPGVVRTAGLGVAPGGVAVVSELSYAHAGRALRIKALSRDNQPPFSADDLVALLATLQERPPSR